MPLLAGLWNSADSSGSESATTLTRSPDVGRAPERSGPEAGGCPGLRASRRAPAPVTASSRARDLAAVAARLEPPQPAMLCSVGWRVRQSVRSQRFPARALLGARDPSAPSRRGGGLNHAGRAPPRAA